MNTNSNDPIGQAILDYSKNKKPFDIVVSSDICEDDIIPIEVLFRNFKDMPDIEKRALKICKGRVLDVGAGAGIHCHELIKNGLPVHAIDNSQGAIEYLKKSGIPSTLSSFESFNSQTKFDTILMMMNGIGIAGTLTNLEKTLLKAKSLLEKGGQLICDSSDIRYLYEDEDGSLWMDLNSEYYGNFKFQMHYKQISGTWFDWLYVDYDNLHQIATKVGFKSVKVLEQDNHYLAQLTLV
jgi:cyclopropane fatty-acyl-phospholipid synthase-like methyltransferase